MMSRLVLSGSAENIGREDGRLQLRSPGGQVILQQDHLMESQQEALAKLIEASRAHLHRDPVAIAHRVVHGGPELTQHQIITEAVLEKLRQSKHFAPLHIPVAVKLIEATTALFPDTPAFACFDTAFHRTMPAVASRFALPEGYDRLGLHRYGFHGLSYESIVHRLKGHLPERAIFAHLGNGSSLCAVKSGISIDTTMGLTPTGGIPMATRSGDLDPGVLLFLLRSEHMNADSLEKMLNHQSGLVALSGGEPDMRELLARAGKADEPAKLAIAVYTTAIRKVIGAYAALLGGVDLLVFTGGIGEHSEEIRGMICSGLEFLNLTPQATNRVVAMPTGEEQQMARVCRSLYAQTPR